MREDIASIVDSYFIVTQICNTDPDVGIIFTSADNDNIIFMRIPQLGCKFFTDKGFCCYG